MTISNGASAQSILNRHVTVRQMSAVKLSQVIDQIGKAANVNFVYNNRTVNADSIVNVNAFNGIVRDLLYSLLGQNYEMRETPGYLVIRYAGGRFILEANFENEGSSDIRIKGRLFDERSKKAVYQASVYEKTFLVSALTDEQGSFEIKIKKAAGFSIVLTASKENYKDTTLNLLQEVAITLRSYSNNSRYDAEAETSAYQLHRGLSGFLMGTSHKIQDLNIGGMFQKSPYQISLTPGLSTHGLYSSQVIDRFSLNILGGYSAGVKGLEGAFLFNIDRRDVRYVQFAGLLNIVGGDVSGVQAAGLFNRVYGSSKGIQFAGLFNKNYEFKKGLQVSPLNLNKKSGGIQVGIINIADSADYSIGLINIIKNGSMSLGLHTDETFYTHLTFRSGGRIVYGILGMGFKQVNGRSSLTADRGLGFHLYNGTHVSINAEGVSQYLFNLKDGNYQINTIRLFPVLFPNKRFSFFAGPSLNLTSWEIPDKVSPAGWLIKRYYGAKAQNALTLGLTGGMQLNF